MEILTFCVMYKQIFFYEIMVTSVKDGFPQCCPISPIARTRESQLFYYFLFIAYYLLKFEEQINVGYFVDTSKFKNWYCRCNTEVGYEK